MGSGRGWTTEETVAACQAYVSASEDPRSGNGKKKDLFSAQVLECYKNFMKEVTHKNPRFNYPDRTGDAIIQRYRKAKCEGIKYEGIIATIKAKKPTGDPTEEDIERAALAVYNGDAKVCDLYTYLRDFSVSAGPEFPLKDALFYLRQTNTWAYILLSRQSRVAQSAGREYECANMRGEVEAELGHNGESRNVKTPSPVESAPAGGSDSVKEEMCRRPTGPKRALEISKQVAALHKGADGIEKLARAAHKRTKVAEEVVKIQKQQSMIALFSMPGTDLEKLQELIEISQAKVLASLRGDLGEDKSNGNPTGSVVSFANPGSDRFEAVRSALELVNKEPKKSSERERINNLSGILN